MQGRNIVRGLLDETKNLGRDRPAPSPSRCFEPVLYMCIFPLQEQCFPLGLRWACLSAALMVAVGAGVRCITDTPPYVKW